LIANRRLKAGLYAFYQCVRAFLGLHAGDDGGRRVEQESALGGDWRPCSWKTSGSTSLGSA
jgi:hypothetical protein